MTYMVLRLRGVINSKPQVRKTLEMLSLDRTNHAVVVPADEIYKGMLQVVKDYVTWGEIDAAFLAEAIKKRGRLTGDRPVTDEHVKANSKYPTIKDFAAAIVKGEFRYRDMPEIKPILRLSPARKGFKSLRRPYNDGGDLGYRGAKMTELLARML